MSFVYVIAGICTFITGIILIALVCDIIKQPWSIYRKKPVVFHSFDLLKTKSDWTEALVLAAVFLVGLAGIYSILLDSGNTGYSAEELDQAYEEGYDYALRDYIDCPYCGEGFPEGLAFETYDGDTICPDCIRDDFNDLLSGEVLRCHNCSSFYFPSDSEGFGLCADCCSTYIRVCHNCGEYTYGWHAEFSFCPACAGELVEEPDIADAIDKYYEG